MKKISLLVVALMILLVGCGSNGANGVTMDKIKASFEENGYMFNAENEPSYSMIGAKDGAWFDKEGSTKTVVYEYSSKSNLDKAMKEHEFMSKFEVNGLFALETSNEDIKKVFKDLK